MILKNFKSQLLLFIFFFSTVFAFAQVTVKGKVTTKENPQGIAAVTIQEKGTTNAVLSSEDGSYTIEVKGTNAVLLFNFVGMKPQSVSVAGKSEINIELEEDVSSLSDVVVTASRQPVRKIETVISVEVISSKQLKTIKPEGIAEAITQTPGIYVNTSQGRRGGVIIRGFPDGGNPLGGLDYTSILLDGLPSFGTTGRLPEAGFGFDLNVERVEVVRGSAATLFGRAAAAGAVNLISRTGGEKISGSVRLTRYDNIFEDSDNTMNYRFDWNVNGPLSKDKTVRFNLGGWFMDDKGFKNTGYKDKGHQLRGNVDFMLPNNKGKVRLYFLSSDYVFQNLTDAPADLNTMKLAGGWKNYETMQNFPSFYNLNYTVYESGSAAGTGTAFPTRRVTTNGVDSITRSIRKAMDDNGYGKTTQLGATFNFNLGNGFTLDNKFRFQSLASGTKYSFALPSFYKNYTVLRLLLDGDSDDQDIMNEFRLSKSAITGKVKHFFQGGHYYSNTRLRPTTYSFVHTLNPSNPDDIKFAPLAPPFVNNPWSGPLTAPRGSITRRGDYTEQVNSVFFGDEMKFGEKLTINTGVRYDWVWISMKETKRPFDKTLTRVVKHKDWSASIGFNYLIRRNIAVFGNLNKAFRAPDYTTYTSLEPFNAANTTFFRVPDGIKKNETIINSELGFRSTIKDFGFDLSVFYTKINDRLSRIFENGIVVSKPFGSNRISGTELSVFYNATGALRGLSVRSSLTYQDAIFTDFKINVDRGSILGNVTGALNVDPAGNLYGNKIIDEGGGNYSLNLNNKTLPSIPKVIWNFNSFYTHKYFGIDFSSNYNGNRFVDPTNVLKYDNLIILNAGAYVNVPFKGKTEIRIGAQVKNLSNNQSIQNIAGLGAGDVALGQKQKTPNWILPETIAGNAVNTQIWGQGYVQLPRRFLIYMSFDF